MAVQTLYSTARRNRDGRSTHWEINSFSTNSDGHKCSILFWSPKSHWRFCLREGKQLLHCLHIINTIKEIFFEWKRHTEAPESKRLSPDANEILKLFVNHTASKNISLSLQWIGLVVKLYIYDDLPAAIPQRWFIDNYGQSIWYNKLQHREQYYRKI